MGALGHNGQVGTGRALYDTELVGASVWQDGTSADEMTFTLTSHSTTELTLGGWVRFPVNPVSHGMIGIGDGGGTSSPNSGVWIDSNRKIVIYGNGNGSASTGVIRDNAWYFFLASFKLDEGTNSEKGKLYLGNELVAEGISGFGTSFNNTTLYTLGGLFNSYGQAKFAQVFFIDGQSVQGGDFAVTDFVDVTTVGNSEIVGPKSDAEIKTLVDAGGSNSAFLGAGIADGTDASTNSNDFTTSTSAAVNGSTDTPSLVENIWNSLDDHIPSGTLTVSDGGAVVTGNVTGQKKIRTSQHIPATSTIKVYAEIEITTAASSGRLGLIGDSVSIYDGSALTSYDPCICVDNRTDVVTENAGTTTDYTSTAAIGNGSYLMLAFDPQTRKVWMGVDGTWWNSGDPAAGTGEVGTINDDKGWAIACDIGGSGTQVYTLKSEADWSSTAPTGFFALNSYNKPDAPSTQGNEVFNALLSTGNGSTQALTGAGFQSDKFWGKGRDVNQNNHIYDSLRGVTKTIISNGPDAESTVSGVTSFDSDGVTLGSANSSNQNTTLFINWLWKLSDAFNIVLREGNATDNTAVPHGMDGAPELIIAKNRTDSASWVAWHPALTGADYVLDFNNNNAQAQNSAKFGGSSVVAPDATNFYVGDNNEVNGGGDDMIYFLWRSIPGICMVDKITGNTSADGPFYDCGFRPRWLMLRRVAGGEWYIVDTARNTVNPLDKFLAANSNAVETGSSTLDIDFYANGFKIRGTSTDINGSGAILFVAMADIAGGGSTLPPIPGR